MAAPMKATVTVTLKNGVLDPQGRPFRYNQRDTLLNGDFVALGDVHMPWQTWCD